MDRQITRLTAPDQDMSEMVTMRKTGEIASRIEELERMVFTKHRRDRGQETEGESGTSGSPGVWTWWENVWWIRAEPNMNARQKRKVSNAVHEAMDRENGGVKEGMNSIMTYSRREARTEGLGGLIVEEEGRARCTWATKNK